VTAGQVAAARRIALVGSPNTGKTTLFNALTGDRSRVGNYPGVTVQRRVGTLRHSAGRIALIDLPGTYSLRGETPDEEVVAAVLHGEFASEARPDALLMVLDATTLERGLALVHEVLATCGETPVALAVTMIDELRARGGAVSFSQLSKVLGVPVFPIVGHRGVGLDPLREALCEPDTWSRGLPLAASPDPTARFAWVDAVAEQILNERPDRDHRTDRIDRVLLHPVAGLCVFAMVMMLFFQSIFTWAVPAMETLEAGVAAVAAGSRAALPPGLAADLWTDGVLAGVGSVIVFVPQIAILFALIHFLDDVGYMARAAFVVDRVMGWVGLQGRSFVVLLSCYACAVPGIMAARTIPNPADRLATILVAPFMTCSARLPVYTLLIAAFVPAIGVWGPLGLQGLVMLGLYLLGAGTALASAAWLKSSIVRGRTSTFFLELPPYRMPTWRLLSSQVWNSVRAFLKRVGTIIFVASIVLWALLNFPRVPQGPGESPAAHAQSQLESSAAGRIGRAIEPAIEPLGYDWRIGVGLVASLAAREVIVSTLAQIYAVEEGGDFAGLRDALRRDVDPRTGRPRFTLPVALSLMVFFVFALQCTSTIAVMARETGSWRWPAFAFTFMLGLAYLASFVTYRIATALV